MKISLNELRLIIHNIIQENFEDITEYEDYVEPKRKNNRNISDIGISQDEGRGVANIMAVYNEAEEEEKDFWGRWYYNSKENVQNLAQRHDIDFVVTAAVVAVLSPGNKWKANLVAADNVIQMFKNPEIRKNINAYGKNVEKAIKILESGDIGYVRGPKVSVFLKSLIDPDYTKDALVLDSHAINIWYGIKRNIKMTPTISTKMRMKIMDDYRTAANKLGVGLQALQATTWYIWKSLKNAPEIPHTNIQVEV
jgi:hypothetical protein